MDSWSKLIFRRNVSKICLKLVENIKHLSRKKREGNNFKSLANSLFGMFAGVSCVLEVASLILAIDCCTSIEVCQVHAYCGLLASIYDHQTML